MSDDETLADLRETMGEAHLSLPIGGRVFRVPEVDGATWLQLQLQSERVEGRKVADDDESLFDTELFRMALTPAVFDDMLTHATGPEIARAGMTAWFWQTGQKLMARIYWESGGKAPSPPNSTSTSTDEASSTPSRGSGTGTTSPKRSNAAAKPRRARAGGRSSSTGG